MDFDWDDANILHLARHDVAPDEAEQVIDNDPVDLYDQYIEGERRFTQAGETNKGRILVVAATLRGSSIRVITAWDASAATKRRYLRQKGYEHGINP